METAGVLGIWQTVHTTSTCVLSVWPRATLKLCLEMLPSVGNGLSISRVRQAHQLVGAVLISAVLKFTVKAEHLRANPTDGVEHLKFPEAAQKYLTRERVYRVRWHPFHFANCYHCSGTADSSSGGPWHLRWETLISRAGGSGFRV